MQTENKNNKLKEANLQSQVIIYGLTAMSYPFPK